MKSYKISMKDGKEPVIVQGRPCHLVDFLDCFYYFHKYLHLYVVCEVTTGTKLGAGSTLKSAKDMALETLKMRDEETVVLVIHSMDVLNPPDATT